ncbi:hypothetical protein BN1708_012771 [Verticillium longisporum]|uniref:Extracellular membrane protein CFEM domain-containing protein n=1 Tax=Verticillium longisporum TaxID=100787 RepID=A0A0G4LDT4_VERLO|nr:hypothetical protein BN1708_012771 [Verticillium longisporum]
MRASIPPLLTLALLARAQNSDRPRCVATCIANDLMASQCDGDEQGAALDECTCVTLSGSPMIACIRDCAPADQGRYAAQLPELCHDRLLPNAEGASGGGGGDDDDDQTTTTRLLRILTEAQSDVSETIESALRPLVRQHTAIHFVKVHYLDIEFDNAAVPSILAYRNQGDMFANLTGIIEMIPDDEPFGRDTLRRLFEKHDIL